MLRASGERLQTRQCFGVRSRWSLAVFVARPLSVVFAAEERLRFKILEFLFMRYFVTFYRVASFFPQVLRLNPIDFSFSTAVLVPVISTMTTNPQLPNHLVRELMNTIRLKYDGDAMVRLALSGRDPFSVFRYVVGNHVFASTCQDSVFLEVHSERCANVFLRNYSDDVRFLTEGSKRLAIRFVRELIVWYTPSMPLPFETIVELTSVVGYKKSFTPTLNSLTDLEVLKLDFRSYPFDDFFNEVIDGNVLLPSLLRLEICLRFDDFLKIMSTTSSFPLPEDVTFQFDIDVVPDLGILQTFPNVKHLKISGNVYAPITSATLGQFSTIVNCFTGLETARLDFYRCRSAFNINVAVVVEFHERLRNTHFSVPTEVNFEEVEQFYNFKSPDPLIEQLKSIGFKEAGRPCRFILQKEFGNVKLKH